MGLPNYGIIQADCVVVHHSQYRVYQNNQLAWRNKAPAPKRDHAVISNPILLEQSEKGMDEKSLWRAEMIHRDWRLSGQSPRRRSLRMEKMVNYIWLQEHTRLKLTCSRLDSDLPTNSEY